MNTLFKQQIEESLNNALNNCPSVLDWSAQQLAEDMVECDASFEEHTPEQLLPFIQSWLDTTR